MFRCASSSPAIKPSTRSILYLLNPNNPVQKNQVGSINRLQTVTQVLAVLEGTESSELKTQKIAKILGTDEFIIVPSNNLSRDVAQTPSTDRDRESIEIG